MAKKAISIYVVEDYGLQRIDLVCELNNKFNILGSFGTAEECIEAMDKVAADIVIMDLGLPKMNGIQATKMIKAKFPLTKVIAYTSYENKEVAMASIASGASAYFTKDTNWGSISNYIEAINEGVMLLDPKIAEIAYEFIPKPYSTDIGNLYKHVEPKIFLTKREKAILCSVACGKNNPQIADEFVISRNTVKAHVCNIMKKLNASNRIQAAIMARSYGLLE